MRLIFKGAPHVPEYRGWHDGRFVHVPTGGTIEINDAAEAALLLKDFPGVFMPAEPEGKAFEAPPIDKMMRKARTK